MKLEVGQFVRTDLGISKINTIRKEIIGTFIGTDNRKGNIHYGNEFVGYLIVDKTEEDKQWIKDHIKNTIIELIEVGDYVNGEEIIEVINDGEMSRVKSIDGTYFNNEINSIVTKEQFEQMQYKVVD